MPMAQAYAPGAVVWAYMDDYPWWPARVISRAQLQLDHGEPEPVLRADRALVMFFNWDDEFAVRCSRHLRPFTRAYRNVNGAYNGDLARALCVAVDMAAAAVPVADLLPLSTPALALHGKNGSRNLRPRPVQAGTSMLGPVCFVTEKQESASKGQALRRPKSPRARSKPLSAFVNGGPGRCKSLGKGSHPETSSAAKSVLSFDSIFATDKVVSGVSKAFPSSTGRSGPVTRLSSAHSTSQMVEQGETVVRRLPRRNGPARRESKEHNAKMPADGTLRKGPENSKDSSEGLFTDGIRPEPSSQQCSAQNNITHNGLTLTTALRNSTESRTRRRLEDSSKRTEATRRRAPARKTQVEESDVASGRGTEHSWLVVGSDPTPKLTEEDEKCLSTGSGTTPVILKITDMRGTTTKRLELAGTPRVAYLLRSLPLVEVRATRRSRASFAFGTATLLRPRNRGEQRAMVLGHAKQMSAGSGAGDTPFSSRQTEKSSRGTVKSSTGRGVPESGQDVDASSGGAALSSLGSAKRSRTSLVDAGWPAVPECIRKVETASREITGSLERTSGSPKETIGHSGSAIVPCSEAAFSTRAGSNWRPRKRPRFPVGSERVLGTLRYGPHPTTPRVGALGAAVTHRNVSSPRMQ